MNPELISVIVPVYNVENYLDKCLESIVTQTYRRIEIILINDGSTDSSGLICMKWREQDSRIRIIIQDNQGLSAARNKGVEEARGRYFVFVDSDDWIERNYIESLYNAIIEYNADFSVCDFYSVFTDKIEIVNIKISMDLIITEDEKKQLFLFGYSCMWSKMYCTEFYKKSIKQLPLICYEDLATFPLLIFSAKKIACVKENLYYYRQNRQGSIMNSPEKSNDFIQALKYGLQSLKEIVAANFFLENVWNFQLKNVRYMLARQKDAGMPKKELSEFRNNIESIWDVYFPEWHRYIPRKAAVMGSFNLRWAIQRLLLEINDLDIYLGFTSLISQFVGDTLKITPKHKTEFRKKMLEQDWNQGLKQILKGDVPDYVFIDFMDTLRYDIYITEDGQYLTGSEAFSEVTNKFNIVKHVKAVSPDFMDLWKQSIYNFISFVDKFYSRKKIVLVKLHLADRYWENGEFYKFAEQKHLAELNQRLGEMEEFFTETYKEVKVIELPSELFYNKEERYERSPYYLNEDCYSLIPRLWIENIGKQIRKC